MVVFFSLYITLSHHHHYADVSESIELLKCLLSGVPDYFDRNKISSGGDLSHYSSASLY